MSNLNSILEAEANRDPVTGALPSHPLGSAQGAGKAGAGTAPDTPAAPVDTATGASVGALVGGFAGRSAAASANPTREDAYWLENYTDRPYVSRGSTFDDYGPAYGFGVAARGRYPGRRFDEVEPDLARDWGSSRGESSLSWDAAKHAVRDAWERVGDAVERASAGNAERDDR
jgi:hypothetical protein